MSVKYINIKIRTFCFFNDIINIKDFDLDNIKIDEKSNKNILIYYTGYVSIKKYLKTYSVNPLYLIFGNVNVYFEEINGNKYLTLILPNESKEKIKMYEELRIQIRNLIRSITKNADDYDEKYMKMKFDSYRNSPLDKTIEIPIVEIVVRAIFHENNKYYLQAFLDKCLHKIQK